MKNQPTPSDHEVLTGLVERATYQNAENGFCVLRVKARGQRELVTLVGHAAAISAANGLQPQGTGSTTAPTVSSSKPGSSRPQLPIGRGHREVPRLGNDPRHWPGLCQKAPARLRREGVRRYGGGAGSPAGDGRHRSGT